MSESQQTGTEIMFAPKQTGDFLDVAAARQAAEIQAAMVIAKKFPRDEHAAFTRIIQSCKRRTLAEHAIYTYPRGGQTISGPSIRLAEALAQAWGNIDFGVIELEQADGESKIQAYAWDLETNTRQTKIFTVRHERKAGQRIQALDDPRDIYEVTANHGARRLRACILGVIPGDVVDAAVIECERTLSSGHKEPLIDRVRKMVIAFGELGVTQTMLEKRLGHRMDATSEPEMVTLRGIWQAIRDGAAERNNYFKPEPPKVVILPDESEAQSHSARPEEEE